MATSNSFDFTVNRDQIIKAAMRVARVLEAGEEPTADEVTDCSQALNMMIKAWQTRDIPLWLRKEATLFVVKGTQSYSLGPTGSNVTTDYLETQLNGELPVSSTAITVDSTTGMSASDVIGFRDGDTWIFDTIASVDTSTTLTLSTGISSALDDDVAVIAFTNKIQRPQVIDYAYRRDASNNDITVDLISRDEYVKLSQKSQDAEITQIHYEPTLTNGTLRVWGTGGYKLILVYKQPIQDFDASTDTADFPVEWLEALKYGLASRIAPEFGVPLREREWLKTEAAMAFEEAFGYTTETGSVQFGCRQQ